MIKNFSGVLQLTSTVNKSVKPLLILTGCFSGKRLHIRKAYIRNQGRVESLQGQGERQCSEVFVTSKTDTSLKASKQSFLSSSLIWSWTDSSNNISYNCCCQCLKLAGAPLLSISCILQTQAEPAEQSAPCCNHSLTNRLRARPARLKASCNITYKHTQWAIKPALRLLRSRVLLRQAVGKRGLALHLARLIEVSEARWCLREELSTGSALLPS